ncbi:hypothetical protein RHGRI_006613 [Rhododendron griersonianum]|uniref:4-alpha-glucanotransferase n=1 Tax=Rhododendron griersonianum TaxID=479676 RepID=A0AAV6KVD8_9ERIC|nr:hypothetical protein RHGRI_006613 [Rhododendron griersonianum]
MVNLGLISGNKGTKSVGLSFRIPYNTQWGQSLVVCGSESVLGSWNVKRGLALSPQHQGDELIWRGSTAVPAGFECEYSYYVVDDDRNVLRWEAGKKRKLVLPDGLRNGEVVELHDLWQTSSDGLPCTSAFRNVIFRKSWSTEIQRPLGVIQTKLDENVPSEFCCDVIEIARVDEVELLNSQLSADICDWQFYEIGAVEGNFCPETGPNRELVELSEPQPRSIILSDGMMREMPWRGAGVAVPMFSVRSEADLGVGEFLDLKILVDWAVESGFHLVQLLPINDTSVHGMWWDSYPYSSLSVFALHPLYLRVQALSERIPEEIKEEIQRAKELLDGKDVDYEATMATKLSIAKKIFVLEKDTILNSDSFNNFFTENEFSFEVEQHFYLSLSQCVLGQGWLKPYAAFCFLRDFFETSDHSQWGRFTCYSIDKLEKLVSKDSVQYDVICFHYYIQFHLHLQLAEAAEYARKKGVVLKGDLPIGVDRNSVDTWVDPNLFRMNTSTGAPPDYFDKNGQNWGFPTYNWEEMSKDNYAWWRARLTQMAKYFTAYRIDHILGFFRIWELPEHAMTGLVGKFRPSIPLSQEELEREGIWDFNRLSRPYIRHGFLQEKFGAYWTVIASNFMNEYEQQRYENIVLIRDPEDASKFYPRFNIEDTSSFKDLDDHSKNVLKRLYYDYYFHRQESLWHQNALKTLPALLNSSDMLACGEDLGLIPSCVHPVMQELGLIGLRIQRMPSEPGLDFGIPSHYSYMTSTYLLLQLTLILEIIAAMLHTELSNVAYWVCAPSCHDCSTLRAWWEEDEERRCQFYKTVVGSDSLPPSRCVPEIAYFILRQHVEAPSMWAIFPLQDLLAVKEEYTTRPAAEETINDPTNPKHYWRFRVHVTLEALVKDKELKSTIKDLIRGSGRSYPPTGEIEVQAGREKGVATAAPTKQQVTAGLEKISLLNESPKTEAVAVL